VVGGCSPQRQLDQKTHTTTYRKLENMLKDFVAANPDKLKYGTSFMEGESTLYSPWQRTMYYGRRQE